MDPPQFPFDIAAYKKKNDFEDTYIVNRFIQRRKIYWKMVHLVVENISREIMQRHRSYLQNIRRDVGRTSNVHFECFKPDLKSSVNQLACGT